MSNSQNASNPPSDDPRELRIYRDRTSALVRRYFVVSMETGRLPSLLGRACFRSRVTSYRMSNFEDSVIFVYDVERCLERLDTDLHSYAVLVGANGAGKTTFLDIPGMLGDCLQQREVGQAFTTITFFLMGPWRTKRGLLS